MGILASSEQLPYVIYIEFALGGSVSFKRGLSVMLTVIAAVGSLLPNSNRKEGEEGKFVQGEIKHYWTEIKRTNVPFCDPQ